MILAISFCVHDDMMYFRECLNALRHGLKESTPTSEPEPAPLPLHVFLSRLPWHGIGGDWQTAARTAEALGATVHLGDWPTEREQRQAACDHLRAAGYIHALTGGAGRKGLAARALRLRERLCRVGFV